MPVLYKHNDGQNREEVVKGDILLPITEITVISRSAKMLEEPEIEENEGDAFAEALASIEDEEATPYKAGDIIRIKTSYKIRSSEIKSVAMIRLKDKERFKLVETGQLVVLDGMATIEFTATVYETPNEYIKLGDLLIEVLPLKLQIQ